MWQTRNGERDFMPIDDDVEQLVQKYDLPRVIAALGQYALYKENALTVFRDLTRTFERAAQKRHSVRKITPPLKERQIKS